MNYLSSILHSFRGCMCGCMIQQIFLTCMWPTHVVTDAYFTCTNTDSRWLQITELMIFFLIMCTRSSKLVGKSSEAGVYVEPWYFSFWKWGMILFSVLCTLYFNWLQDFLTTLYPSFDGIYCLHSWLCLASSNVSLRSPVIYNNGKYKALRNCYMFPFLQIAGLVCFIKAASFFLVQLWKRDYIQNKKFLFIRFDRSSRFYCFTNWLQY